MEHSGEVSEKSKNSLGGGDFSPHSDFFFIHCLYHLPASGKVQSGSFYSAYHWPNRIRKGI